MYMHSIDQTVPVVISHAYLDVGDYSLHSLPELTRVYASTTTVRRSHSSTSPNHEAVQLLFKQCHHGFTSSP